MRICPLPGRRNRITDLKGLASGQKPKLRNRCFPDGFPDGFPNGFPDGFPNGFPDGFPDGFPVWRVFFRVVE